VPVVIVLTPSNLNPKFLPLQIPLHRIPMIPLNDNYPFLNRSSGPTVLFQILGKGFQGLIIEIESKHSCHGLPLPAFGLTSDTDGAVLFELRLGIRPFPFLFAGTAGNRFLALRADAAFLG